MIISFLFVIAVFADESDNSTILIISSYNPETSNVASNISDLMNEFALLDRDKTRRFNIENMNCRNFPDAAGWKNRMYEILQKYSGKNTPDMIILLGQEAWSSFISQNDERLQLIPIMSGMASRNAIVLPDSLINLTDWEPESIDVLKDMKKYNIVAGYFIEYDIEKNINLILDIYPNAKNIALITDNTYGGVALQAHVRQNMKKFPQLNFIPLDGRKYSIYTITQVLSNLPENTVILLGSWRVDSNEGYFMSNSTYSLRDVNPNIPAFTLTTLGLGHWAIGGYVPEYRSRGKEMARQVVNYFNKSSTDDVQIEIVPNNYVFDYKRLENIGYNFKKLPPNSEILNKGETFWEKYSSQIIMVGLGFVIFFGVFLFILRSYINIRKLNHELENSQIEIEIAKERAEESDRLKTAFIANMSHEIRTPLNAIVGFSNILAMGDCTQEEMNNYKNIIYTNSDLLLILINNIMDFARLEVDSVQFDICDCEIVSICNSAISSVFRTKNENIEVVFNPPVDSFVINTDANRLQQILSNLLLNSSKFTQEGKITLKFEIDEKNNRILFSVTDTGCGIDKSKHEIIFKRFQKLDVFEQGTGLGLPISKLTINKLGGDIWIDPDYTNGARFVFSHPIKLNRELFKKPT